jgi:Phage integrase family
MALAVNGSGTISKKCDLASHRPGSNQGCAAMTCQHMCAKPERCPHAWTLRYWVNGKQREKSFRDKTYPSSKRVDFGSGRKLAEDWQLQLTVNKRSGDITFADHGKTGKQKFGEACEQFTARMRVNENTRLLYKRAYRTCVRPAFGDRTLAQVARDRDGVTELLSMTMKHLSNSPRQQARLLIVGTCDEAVKAGRLPRHNLADIGLALKHRKTGEYRDVPVPSWLWTMVKAMPDGPLMPGRGGKLFQVYNAVYLRFAHAAKAAGVPAGFTPHSLRHAFASAMLARGVPISIGHG